MTYDRPHFYTTIRAPLFRGHMSGADVAGCEAILAEAERRQVAPLPAVA